MKTKSRVIRTLVAALLVSSVGCGGGGGGGSEFQLPTPPVKVRAEVMLAPVSGATGLVFLPDGRLLYNEIDTGNVRVVQDGALLPEPYLRLEPSTVPATGLLGIAADADFAQHPFIYVFQNQNLPAQSRVVRFRDFKGKGVEPLTIIDGIPIGGHDGGKILSHPDGTLYITGGDAGDPANSQNPATLAGKILHITREGKPASSNPDRKSPIVASGFRNAFGIALHPETRAVYLSENGPTCDDEVDRLESGGNYGWRLGQPCGDTDPHYVPPVLRISPTVGVTGMAFYRGAAFPEWQNQLLLGDFNTGAVRRYAIEDGDSPRVVEEAIAFPGGSGPIVDLAVGPDGNIYFTTLSAIVRLVRDAS